MANPEWRSAAGAPLDVRDELWRDGPGIIRSLTGKPGGASRAYLGRLAKQMNDDLAGLLAILRDASAMRPIDPASWISAAIKHRSSLEGDGRGSYGWLADLVAGTRQAPPESDKPGSYDWLADLVGGQKQQPTPAPHHGPTLDHDGPIIVQTPDEPEPLRPEPLRADGAAQSAEAPSRPGSLRVLTPAQCEATQPRPYVIKGLIGAGDHAVLIGQPGSGKSVLAPHLAYAVAQGREVMGRRVRGGPVLYIAAEDGHGMTARVRALRNRWGEAPDFHLVPDAVDLLNPESGHLEQISELVRALRPALVVIDTLARAFPGLQENEAYDMGRVVKVARDLAAICGSAVTTVHHVPKDAGTTPRGHGSLSGDADVTILVEGAGSDVRSVRLGKNRNGPSDATFTFGLEVQHLGTDEDGDPIPAPIAAEVSADATRLSNSRAREAKLPERPALMLRATPR